MKDHAASDASRIGTFSGRARAVLDDPEYTARIFAELRTEAIKGFGTLIEIQLD